MEHRDTHNTYDAAWRLIGTRYFFDTAPPPANDLQYYQSYSSGETYRYDALGRRVYARVVRSANCPNKDQRSGCLNLLKRTVWDGEQVLYELSGPGDSASSALDTDPPVADSVHGVVGYVHGGGIDRPLALAKTQAVGGPDLVLPYANYRGMFMTGTCPTVACQAPGVWFPEPSYLAFGDPPLNPNGPPSWHGSIIEGGQDASGYQYRRNRYYDPSSGRFTQEDPIGLAGGLNLYGFANGDPVNFSDPFGLCPLLVFCGVEYEPGVTPPSSLRVTAFLHVLALVEQRNVIVESGIRSGGPEGHNAQVHGATDSCHITGCAADIRLEGEGKPETARAVYGHSTIRSALGIREIYEADPANEHTGTHVDTRTGIGDRYEPPQQRQDDPKKIHYVPLKPKDMK